MAYYHRNAFAYRQPRAADPETIHAWVTDHPTEHAWMVSEAPRFEFAQSMLTALHQWGRLTDNQLATVQRLTAGAAERKAAYAARKAQEAANAPTCEVAAIETAFNRAKDAGIKYPKLRLGGFTFSPAGATSTNAGAVYVKEGDLYLGKVLGGRFQKSRDCSPEKAVEIVDFAADPHTAAVAYGKQFGRCAVCAKELSDPDSVARGIGPVCAERYGWGV
jgi:Family of unknown function (DUF6011)